MPNRGLLFLSTVLLVLGFGCARNVEPKSSFSRGPESTLSNPTREFGEEINVVSPAGSALLGKLGTPDLLQPRDPKLDTFGDQYNISQSEREKVVQVANFLKQNPSAHLLIEGYCDWKGTPAYNKALGDRRASTIKEFMVELGADPNRIDTLSIGDESAIPNASRDEARLDRRADFLITKDSI
jgi:peptidoglycan-associated lipoprotein